MPLTPSHPPAPPSLGSLAGQPQFLRLVHFSALLQRLDFLTHLPPNLCKSDAKHRGRRGRGPEEILPNSSGNARSLCDVPHDVLCLSWSRPRFAENSENNKGPPSSGNQNIDATKKTLKMLQVTGRELLTEEFFSLVELLHRLQQVGQVVHKCHGSWVLLPQLEAASSQVSKKQF